MDKGVRKKTKILTAGIAVVLCASSLAQATLLYVQDITLTIIPPTVFYSYSSGSGSLSYSNNSCGIAVTFAGSSDYTMSSGKVTISSALVQDTSSGDLASGDFQGGSTLTLTGRIKYKGTTFYNGTIFAANMVLGADETWRLVELDDPYLITIDNGSVVQFLPGTTGLGGSGITYGDDTLKLGNFKADFSFKSVTPDPSRFDTPQTLSGTASTIQIVATAPEPATILLLSTAMLALRIRNFKGRNL